MSRSQTTGIYIQRTCWSRAFPTSTVTLRLSMSVLRRSTRRSSFTNENSTATVAPTGHDATLLQAPATRPILPQPPIITASIASPSFLSRPDPLKFPPVSIGKNKTSQSNSGRGRVAIRRWQIHSGTAAARSWLNVQPNLPQLQGADVTSI